MKISLNNEWQFTPALNDTLNEEAEWTDVRLPHTIRETPYNYFDEHLYQMVAGYRKTITVPESWEGKSVDLVIGAAGHLAEVFLNGEKIAEHRCGYTAFTCALDEHLEYGADNTILIKVDSRESNNIPPFGYAIDYMTYGGLYREVWLEVREKQHLTSLFLKPSVDERGNAAELTTEIAWSSMDDLNGMSVRQTLLKDGSVISEKNFDCSASSLQRKELPDGSEECFVSVAQRLKEVTVWDIENPALYTVVTQLLKDGTVLDRREERIGFRYAAFRKDGFYLNGRKLKLRGLNRHQSYPYVGYAMPASQQRHDADILKYELGLNAVRTSHYPQSHDFIDRCDEIGLLVFAEIPGWQHLGDAEWKKQTVINTREMVEQYRNHTSIILWGVRVNESEDEDELYQKTNDMAHLLDDTRQTGGVRYLKKSHLLEDVYTYNDFVHDGKAVGAEPKKNITSDMEKGYLVSEYCGHMYPTKTFDSEAHRTEHTLRHANILDAIAKEEDIAGGFGWCMFDYNTHKDFGSGDRICYHGVMDMFRNPKMASDLYAAQQDEKPVLAITSAMDIGEHPTGNPGMVYIISNADSVRMYKNDVLIREYEMKDSAWKNMKHGPVLIDDFIGDQMIAGEGYTKEQSDAVKYILNWSAVYGNGHFPPKVIAKAAKLMVRYHMNPGEAYQLYGRYIGNWGGKSTTYRFEAVKRGQVVNTVVKSAMTSIHLTWDADHTDLKEERTYDVSSIRLAMRDQNGNVMPFYQGPVTLSSEGPIEIVGPHVAMLRGGYGGTYVRTKGIAGNAALVLTDENGNTGRIEFNVTAGE